MSKTENEQKDPHSLRSLSPQRHSFQKEGYVKRMEEKGEDPNPDYLDMFDKILNEHDHKFDDPKSREINMEWDLTTTDWILEKVRASQSYAQNLYAAMCNNDFQKLEVMPILANKTWGCSWRYAGGIVADMRQEGDYIDWYCTGIRDTGPPDEAEMKDWTEEQHQAHIDIYSKYVPESVVTDEIRADLKRLGWLVLDDQNDNF